MTEPSVREPAGPGAVAAGALRSASAGGGGRLAAMAVGAAVGIAVEIVPVPATQNIESVSHISKFTCNRIRCQASSIMTTTSRGWIKCTQG